MKEHIQTTSIDTKLVFLGQVNGYLSAENLRSRVWKSLIIYAGITDRVRLHDLRGSYADIALARTKNIKFIQNQLGHHKCKRATQMLTSSKLNAYFSTLDFFKSKNALH